MRQVIDSPSCFRFTLKQIAKRVDSLSPGTENWELIPNLWSQFQALKMIRLAHKHGRQNEFSIGVFQLARHCGEYLFCLRAELKILDKIEKQMRQSCKKNVQNP